MSTSVTSGGTFLRFRAGTTGASGSHVAYITRERAVLDREQALLLFQLPEHVRASRDYAELRQALISYAETREEIEVAQHTARGEPRTHYRVTASFERDVSNERALAMAEEWLQREFPRSRAFAVVHRDTEQTHLHIWIDARQVDAKKIQLPRQQHRRLDLAWNEIYSREMGRDPMEHERKKEQTREAKRQAWERGDKPELPERVHTKPQELVSHWQRREVGEQASKEWTEHPDGPFLERVREVAGQDLREARSWEELDRRLDRHGLRIERRGAGMVITDGRHFAKASSVDREASRGSLEKRFGETLSAHRERSGERNRSSRQVLEVVDDFHTLDRRDWLKADLGRQTQRLESARARVAELWWARERMESATQAFDSALVGVYRKPAKARESFEKTVRINGVERAAQEMRDRPESYGQIHEAENRRLLGGSRGLGRDQIQERARNAAALGREASLATVAAPDDNHLMRAERAVQRAELRVRKAEERLERTRDNARTRVRIGLALRKLAPHQLNELHRMISAPHRQIALELNRAARKLAPEHVRDLVHWARAPHLALPASASRAFRNLLHDRAHERGSH